ncbi:hypothetical protein HUJ04_007512 [Dendroctonus ponderosae]|uniref:AN1-type domain-containing protein n=1 Tax=Dendroctonus ponderosae TaxID=77166 RepID=A0AAR5QHS5_DENPD|nr:hypothetical protein HUJ04_007512 [Dendroctonus ponderosae]
MSDDGFSDGFDESSIEIQVETLMGTTFDIKVSCNDTIGAIKKKICRVRGIPVNHQRLLFQSNELKDTTTLCDSGLENGSTLILVNSMRGGPIIMRKLPGSTEQYLLKELTGILHNAGEEMLRSNVSLILFRKGDIINFLRVIENEDGTYSPYSDNPISPPSKPSRKEKIDVFDRLSEDTEMCTKIATLRKNMKELNMKKRIRSRFSNADCATAGQDAIGGEKPNSNDEENYDSYKLMEECAVVSLDNFNLTIFENTMYEASQSESEEIALKDKHRTKPKVIQTVPAKESTSKHICNEKKLQETQPRENLSKTSKRRELSTEKFERSPEGYLTFSRNRNLDKIDDCQTSSRMNSKSTNYDETLRSLDISLGNSCVLPRLTNLENKEEVSLTLKNSQNQFLLEGLHSNKLPDLQILETDHFLTKDIGDRDQIAENNVGCNPNKTDNGILNIPEANTVGMSSSRCIDAAKRLPNLTNRIGRRAFGSFTPDLTSRKSNTMGSRTANSASLMSSVPLASNYYMPSGNRPSRPPSTISPRSMGSVQNKQCEHRSYTMDGVGNIVSHSSNSLDTSVRNFTRLEPIKNLTSSRCESPVSGAAGGTSVEEMSAQFAEQLHLLDGESATDVYEESLSVRTRNRVHLTRLLIASEGTERSKSSSDGIELDKHTQDFWEIHESVSNRLKRSATCKVGMLQRRQEVEYNYDSLGNSQTNMKPDIGNFSKSSSDIGVCSGSANYCIPQYMAAPSAIPPQYAPKHHPKYCDLFFTDEPRSPLYSRKNKKENLENKEQEDKKSRQNSENDCSSIQRIKNDETLFESRKEINADGLIGYYNLGCSTDVIEKAEELETVVKLPAVVKKKSRCNHCNKRLNITNIYDCRCGKIFCSQHRYSEVHSCTYNYKTEGRKLLERQNPLVTADKVQKF